MRLSTNRSGKFKNYKNILSRHGSRRYKKYQSLYLIHNIFFPNSGPRTYTRYPSLIVVPGHTKMFFRSGGLKIFAKYVTFSKYDPRPCTKHPSLALGPRYKNILP